MPISASRTSDKCVTLSDDMVDDRTGFTPYAGRIVTGCPDSVLRRGRVVAEGGAVTVEAGSAAPIRRGLRTREGTALVRGMEAAGSSGRRGGARRRIGRGRRR